MPKGKPRKKYSSLYQDAPITRPNSNAPQAAAHRRGGTHRVKDEDKTGTVYDGWDYKQLKAECIDRGIYVKDMKKVAMTKALADFDRDKKRVERDAIIELERLRMQQEKEQAIARARQHKIEVAKRKRQLEKEAKRDRDESVSDDTPDEDELQMMHNELLGLDQDDNGDARVGEVLSDESWDSTSTESTSQSSTSIVHSSKLRLFEWQYPDLPPEPPTKAPQYIFGLPNPLPERKPHAIPYIPLKVHSTLTSEKLFLPGQTYPPGIPPDYVPALPFSVIHAARNGHLTGLLRNATIERASTWSSRTHIQGSTAMMFFTLPSRNGEKNLKDVYDKWYFEDRKLLRVRPRGGGDGDGLKADRVRRHTQRRLNKRRKLMEVYETYGWRPVATGYLPVYLDAGNEDDIWRYDEEWCRLENLFYVRFEGCDVPHYYFWTRAGEWEDPCVRNPDWKDGGMDMKGGGVGKGGERAVEITQEEAVVKTLARVKRPTASVPSSRAQFDFSPSALESVLPNVERYLYIHGLAATLSEFRSKWIREGKETPWRDFGCMLPQLYPSGQMPNAPPVHADGAVSVALKIASIEVLGEKTLLPPYTGTEPWTSDDDALWDIREMDKDIEAQKMRYDHANLQHELQLSPMEVDVLYRRASVPYASLSPLSNDYCTVWLDQVHPAYDPLSPSASPHSSVKDDTDPALRQEWEEIFLQRDQRGMTCICSFCLEDLSALSFKNQATHMHSHSDIPPISRCHNSLPEPSLVALPPAARKPSCHFTLFRALPYLDPGNEADTETSPILHHRKSAVYIAAHSPAQKEKRRRRSTQTHEPPATASTHIPTPCLPRRKQVKRDDGDKIWTPRKLSDSSFESLELTLERRRAQGDESKG